MSQRDPELDTYRSLAEFRYQIRRFLRFSEEAARAAGLEPQQHQMLLSIKGLPEGVRPRIGELAERLQVQHHTAVELLDRLEENGYVERRRSEADRREVLISLTPRSEAVLRELTLHHHDSMQTYGPLLVAALDQLIGRRPGPRTTAGKRRRVLAFLPGR